MTDLQELRALLAKATPGPWYAVHDVALCEVNHADGSREFPDANSPQLPGNAALIVAAVNALPALLDRLEQAEARNARLERVAELCRDWFHAWGDAGTPDGLGEAIDNLDNLDGPDAVTALAALNEPGEKS